MIIEDLRKENFKKNSELGGDLLDFHREGDWSEVYDLFEEHFPTSIVVDIDKWMSSEILYNGENFGGTDIQHFYAHENSVQQFAMQWEKRWTIIKNHIDKFKDSYLIILFPGEAFLSNNGREGTWYDSLYLLHIHANKYGVPLDKIIYFCLDNRIEENYKKWKNFEIVHPYMEGFKSLGFDENPLKNVGDINVIGGDFDSYYMLAPFKKRRNTKETGLDNIPTILTEKIKSKVYCDKVPPKIFLNTNNKGIDIRKFITSEWKKRNIYDMGYISEGWNDIYLDTKESRPDLSGRITVDQVTKMFPFYENSYFSVVVEASSICPGRNQETGKFDVHVNNWNPLMLTEKTYKSILFGHPFLVIGSRGTLSHLREMGYETFDEIFDESYDNFQEDNVCDWTKRVHHVVNEVERICKLNSNVRHDLFLKIREKVMHNKEWFFTNQESTKLLIDKFNKIKNG